MARLSSLRIERSGSEPRPGTLCFVPGQDILLFRKYFCPWTIVVFEQYGQQTLTIVVDTLLSQCLHPGVQMGTWEFNAGGSNSAMN